MKRRCFLLGLASLPVAAAGPGTALRGRLVQEPLRPPGLRTPDGKTIELEGDDATLGVLRDTRLKNEDFEAAGRFTDPGRFRIEPIHDRALFVYRGGKRLVVTYWCETCAIRTYTPGICICCQEETAFDPRDPAL